MSKSEPFDEKLIPFTCTYGLFDHDKKYLSGNLDEESKKDAVIYLKNPKSAEKQYFCVERKNGYCIVNYDVKAHFASHFWHKLFPNLEAIILISFIIFFITILILSSLSFGKKLKKELRPLLEQVEQIQKRELSFEIKYSKVKEFNDVIFSLDHMKTALSQSLKKQWEAEQERKFHIAALAHDIKTPLTIIKGNAELIKEENVLSEIYHHADSINKSSDKIERYINLLIEVTKNNTVLVTKPETMNLQEFINKIIAESENLCKAENIILLYEKVEFNVVIKFDKDLLLRAVLNIVKNAIEHSFSGSKINLYFSCSDDEFCVKIEDFGTGFTEEALKNAKEQFYTEKKQRAEEHYGLGLYIADSVAKSNGGTLELYNKSGQPGAVVRLTIPIDRLKK
ncbi:sensor histidine kinase [Aminipila terrae]|uniref:histidine kinase n=1 Tax=Aminipila terrae TaxID=2697030 RepID=A0A6P1MC19_9FIRM|nr:HAMP domain-containing sensor histidine kinase [Aminipila terrae]QHI72249.1 hypothetical protein Ami3637_07390 [Aminipila terrae]